jgi:hypothetical protein
MKVCTKFIMLVVVDELCGVSKYWSSVCIKAFSCGKVNKILARSANRSNNASVVLCSTYNANCGSLVITFSSLL